MLEILVFFDGFEDKLVYFSAPFILFIHVLDLLIENLTHVSHIPVERNLEVVLMPVHVMIN